MKKYIFLLVVIATACHSLDQYPLNGPSSETFLTDETELMQALLGAYNADTYEGPYTGMPYALALDAGSDIGYDRNASGLQKFATGNGDANNVYAKDTWKLAYTVIGRCNYLLDNMHNAQDAVSESVYKTVEAEARFLRAYTYGYLIELYGGVPLVTHVLTLDEANMPRNTKDEVLDFVLSELDAAAAVLPNRSSGTGRASKGACLAIKARAALFGERWDIAATAAKAVIDLGVYELHPDFAELFMYAGQNSKEIIWAQQFDKSAKTKHATYRNFASRNAQGHSNKVPSQSLIDAYQCVDGEDIDKSPLYDPKKPYENRDPRLSYTIALPGSIFVNYQFETHKDSTKCWNYNTNPPTRVTNQDATNAYATFTGYCFKKYVDIIDMPDPARSEMNTFVIRYAEVLLTYAEAKIEANQIDQSVYDAINAVRQRPSVNMPPLPSNLSQTELRSAVRKERLYELAGEGLRLYDIRRWKIAEQVMNGPLYGRVPRGLLSAPPVIDENGIADYTYVPDKDEMRVVEVRKFTAKEGRDYLWPIPQVEMTANPALEQNPGY